MIDTVCLTFNQADFHIMDHTRFSPSTENLFRPPYIKVTGRQPFKAVNNPRKIDKEEHGYCPRITLLKAIRKGGFAISIRVEFSVPKLLYGNNFDEVVESDFGEVCWKLSSILEHMGIKIIGERATIANAAVAMVHYSKNIVLTDHTTPYSFLKEFEKINVNKALDMSKTDFRNEGHAVKYHSNHFEVIMYDKLKDLEEASRSENRSVEKDNYSQMSIFDTKFLVKPFEILRLEVRIGNRKKIQSILKKYGIEDKSLTFNDLFSKEIAQKVLLSIIQEVEERYPKILLIDVDSKEDVFVQICNSNPKNKLRKNLVLFALRVLIEEIGVRKFRKIIEGYGASNWYALNKDMKETKIEKRTEVFGTVRAVLEEFHQVKLKKYIKQIPMLQCMG